jgi:hypothetical protein
MRHVMVLLLAAAAAPAQEVPYGVAETPWNDELGNHRALVRVEGAAPAVRVHLPWRRHDAGAAAAGEMVVFPARRGGTQVRNVVVVERNAEFADIVFEPAADAGATDYFVYTMPHQPARGRRGQAQPTPAWTPATPDPDWAARARAGAASLPVARVLLFEARTAFDSFYPMEVTATDAEVRELGAKHPSEPYLLFAEDRAHPIRMTDRLPLRWIQNGPSASFSGAAQRNEFYVFQAGLYAQPNLAPASVPVTLDWSDLRNAKGAAISASALRCFNAGGTDYSGQAFRKNIAARSGRVTVLWFGVEVPADAEPGEYRGTVRIRPEGAGELPLAVSIAVGGEHVRDGGVDVPRNLARLKWLDSTLGSEDTITRPYTPLAVSGSTVSCLGRSVRFGGDGFPASVRSGALELLARPVALRVLREGRAVTWQAAGAARVLNAAPAKVSWEAVNRAGALTMSVRATAEFDGGTRFDVKLTAAEPTPVSDVALEVPFPRQRVPLIAGMALDGGYRPRQWSWKFAQRPGRWAEQGSNLEYFIWLGDAAGGLYVRLLSPRDDWEQSPDSGVEVVEQGGEVLFRAHSGARTLPAGRELNYSFRLLATPVKPHDPNPYRFRYAHAYKPIDEVVRSGATVLNIHHATPLNLWINYPFLNLDTLGPYVQEAHRAGLKLKIYYTIRELTTRLPELWALRSLGDEIYRVGGVQGHGQASLDYWLREHLVDQYAAAWVTRVPGGEIDAAIRTRPGSRLNNFYLEGLKWLFENVQIDGLYLDEIGYPREMMRRVRRVLDAARPGALIDLHGNRVWWSCNSPIGYYMEHLPYIDQLWLGEAFNPDSPPEFWLVEMSGIPFGLYGEMLENPNPWRGMLFGMSAREYWSQVDPAALWKFWKDFGIEGSRMVGWWNPACPVKTGRADVPATVYLKGGKALIAVASWAKEPAEVRLSLDPKIFGAAPRLRAVTITGFQGAAEFNAKGTITVPPGKGWLLVAERGAGRRQ